MESSMSHLGSRRSRIRFSFSDRELSLRAFHPLLTKLAAQYRRECVKNLVEEQRSGARSEAGSVQYKFQHRVGNKPTSRLAVCSHTFPLMIELTLMAAWSALAISLSCSNLGLLPRISGNQNCPTAPFMCPIFPCAGAGALTHCDGSRPTPHTM